MDYPALHRVYKNDFLIFGYSFTLGGSKFPEEPYRARCIETKEDPSVGQHIDLITLSDPPKSIDDFIWPTRHKSSNKVRT